MSTTLAAGILQGGQRKLGVNLDANNKTIDFLAGFSAALGADLDVVMGDVAGANKISFQDSGLNEVASLDSDGLLSLLGGINLPYDGGIVNIGIQTDGSNTAAYLKLQANQLEGGITNYDVHAQWGLLTGASDAYLSLSVPTRAVVGTQEIIRYRGESTYRGIQLINDSHVILASDGGQIQIGIGNDLTLSTDGTNGIITTPNGYLSVVGNTNFSAGIDVTGDITLGTNLVLTPTGSGIIYSSADTHAFLVGVSTKFQIASAQILSSIIHNFSAGIGVTGNITFSLGTETIAGIENQNLLDKTAAETVSAIWKFTADRFTIGDSFIANLNYGVLLNQDVTVSSGAGYGLEIADNFIGTANASSLIGISVQTQNVSANLTNSISYGIRIQDINVIVGSVADSYGLWIETIAAGSGNNYSIYSEGGNVHLAGLAVTAGNGFLARTTAGLLSYRTNAEVISDLAIINDLVDDTTPQLGGNLDLNSKGITEELTAATTLAAGDLCYMNGSGQMDLADADAEATCDTLLAICLDALTVGMVGTFLLFGRYTTTGLTAGAEYFVSLTAGDWTATRPSATADIVRHVGTAISTTVLFFNPSHTYVEIV